MKDFARYKAPVLFIALLLVLMSGWVGDPVKVDAQGGPVIQTFPSPGVPGPPLYANFAANFVPSDNGMVAIAFYREPSCIPAGFDLLGQIDFAGAFGCDLTVEGKLWWHDPATDFFPFQIRFWELGAVPIYFVDEAELAGAAQDGILTIGELQALPSLLIGLAETFEQVIHNSNQAPGAEEQLTNKGHETLSSAGTLIQSGRPFLFHYVEQFDPNTGIRIFPTVRIDIE